MVKNSDKSPSPPFADAALRRILLLLLLMAFAVVLSIGPLAYLIQAAAIRQTAMGQLENTAEHLATEISYRMRERRADVEVFAGSPLTRVALSRWLTTKDAGGGKELVGLMERFHRHYGFGSIELLAPSGRPLLAVGRPMPRQDHFQQEIKKVRESGALVFLDLHRHERENVQHMVFLAPVFALGPGKQGLRAVAAFELEPENFLFPLLRSGSAGSVSGESVLLRRAQKSVVNLSALRHRPAEITYSHAFPPDLGLAALRIAGQETPAALEGLDYRGVRVLAAGRPVAGTPWHVLVKMDKEEALAEIRQLAYRVALFSLAAVAVIVAVLAFFWQRRRFRLALQDAGKKQELAAASTALNESRRDLNRAQAVAQIGSWRLNVHRNELLWSEENHRIFGIPPGTPLTYEIFHAAVHPEDRDYVDRRWQAALRGEPYDIEHRLLVDGVVKWVREKAELEFDDAGVLAGGFGTTQDITARKVVEAQREEARREAERLTRVKSEFLANMSHEIRTPLHAVLGLAQLGLRENEGRRGSATFARILDAGGVLLEIVNDILDFSKIEADKMTLEMGSVNPGLVIDRAVDLTVLRAQAKGLKFLVEEAADLPVACQGDSLRLSQILVNLIGNAIKFTPAGGKVVLAAGRDGERLIFRVSDTGIGISGEDGRHLFAPFEQADGSITRGFGGTGLGLAISRRLAALMGGDIRWQSRTGAGSVFEFSLPLIAAVNAPVVSGSVVLAGLAAADGAEVLATVLSGRGVHVRILPRAVDFPVDADLVVLDAERLTATETDHAVHQALERKQRVALVASLPSEGGISAALRDRIVLLERPLRARHLLGVLGGTMLPVPPMPQSGPRLTGLSILAAEDNEVNRLVLSELLAMEGVRLHLVENGRLAVEAVEAAGADFFDIVLMDIQMPEMDGYEATRRLRRIAPELPVLGLTAHAMQDERQRCLAAGMVDHVVKPFRIGSLVRTILRHSRRSPGAASAGAVNAGGASPAAAIDWPALEKRFRGGRAFVDRLVATVLQTNREVPAALRDAARRQDRERVRTLVHGVKGMAGNLSAWRLHEAAKTLERSARDENDIPGRALRFAAILEEFLAELANHKPADQERK